MRGSEIWWWWSWMWNYFNSTFHSFAWEIPSTLKHENSQLMLTSVRKRFLFSVLLLLRLFFFNHFQIIFHARFFIAREISSFLRSKQISCWNFNSIWADTHKRWNWMRKKQQRVWVWVGEIEKTAVDEMNKCKNKSDYRWVLKVQTIFKGFFFQNEIYIM